MVFEFPPDGADAPGAFRRTGRRVFTSIDEIAGMPFAFLCLDRHTVFAKGARTGHGDVKVRQENHLLPRSV